MKLKTMLIGLLLVLSACSTTEQAVNETTIDVGALLILSGLGADWGEATLNGMQLAVEDVNADGGVNGKQLTLIVEDNPADDARQGLNAYRALSGKTDLIIGPSWSKTGLSVAPVACAEGHILLSPTVGAPTFAQTCDNVFNVYSADIFIAYDLGKALAEQGVENLAVLGTLEPWYIDNAEALKQGYEDNGGTLVHYEITPLEDNDFQTESLKLKEADAVFVLVNFAYMGRAAEQLRTLNPDVQLYTTFLSSDMIENGNGGWEGALVAQSFNPDANYAKRYERVYGKQPTVGSDTGYDAVRILVRAIEHAGSEDVEAVLEALQFVHTYHGVSGNLTFDEHGAARKDFVWKQVENDHLADP